MISYDLLRRFVLVFFYDILIYSPTLQDHLTHLDIIMNLLQTQLFFTKLSKCSFATSTVSYLGHIISPIGVPPEPEKIKAITNWSQPRSLTALRAFLDLTGFYRKFIRNYATLAARQSPNCLFQQKDVPPSPSNISVCERDVCHHRSHKKMASVLVQESFQNIHKAKEPQHTDLTNNTDTRTTKLDSKTPRI